MPKAKTNSVYQIVQTVNSVKSRLFAQRYLTPASDSVFYKAAQQSVCFFVCTSTDHFDLILKLSHFRKMRS